MTEYITENDAPTFGHIDIVEDDESLRISIADMLKSAGYHVSEWGTAGSFLSHLPQSVPAVILTDVRMPGMSGLELHEFLIKHFRTIPIIYMSGESTVSQGIKAMKLGAIDFLVKPFTREELFQSIIRGLEKDRIQIRLVVEKNRIIESISSLTLREREVMELLLKGFNNTEISKNLKISVPTSKQYKSQLMKKLGVSSLSQLMQLARK